MSVLLSDLVSRSARSDGGAIAFRDPQSAITYAELERKTAQLAGALQASRFDPGDRVAICMPSSVLTGIAVHGVFRSGGVFVPIDPDAPVGRIRSILESCDIRHILAHPTVRAKITDAASGLDLALLVGIESDHPREIRWEDIWEREPEFRAAQREPEQLAYVMFTSGSTGTPKGIAHSHRSGMAYVTNSADLYQVTPADAICATGPLHFDISTMAYLTAIAAGATAVVLPQAYARIPASMSQFLAEAGVTILYTAASGLVSFIERGALEKHDLSALRWVLFCGEPLSPVKLAKARAALPHAWFSNSYGPAEVNQCTYYNIPPGTDAVQFESQIPIGKAWAHTVCKILDGDREVPEGELVIHTPTMMKGYWRRPDLNARAFHLDASGRRYYRSGDMAWINSEGDYVLVGRVDRQIKVRGYRVELDEIELVLSEHPAVEEVAAFPVRSDDTVTDIGAAVRSGSQDSGLRKTLLRYLEDRLPPYAVPRSFQILSDLPRTSSGKIDRRALSLAVNAAGADG